MKNEIDIGKLEGKILVFGGVYSNLQALEQLKQIATSSGIDNANVICTGDIVGYCAQPEACISFVKDWGVHSILGNVEIQIRDEAAFCGCNFEEGTRCDLLSKSWYPFALEQVSEKSKQWLHDLPDFIHFQYGNKNYFVLHGGYDNVSEFIFKSTPWETKERIFQQTNSDVILSGHCGLPFHEQKNDLQWLNPGVIGMPANDGTPRVWYMILNEQDDVTFAHHAFTYEQERTVALMKQNNLPASYAETLITGIWDNCDILPSEETAQQGAIISF